MMSLRARFYLFLGIGALVIWLMKTALEYLYYSYWVHALEMPDYVPNLRTVMRIILAIALVWVFLNIKPWRLLKK